METTITLNEQQVEFLKGILKFEVIESGKFSKTYDVVAQQIVDKLEE